MNHRRQSDRLCICGYESAIIIIQCSLNSLMLSYTLVETYLVFDFRFSFFREKNPNQEEETRHGRRVRSRAE